MSAHTPGPWAVWEGHAEVYAGVKSNDSGQITSVGGRVADCSGLDDDDEPNETAFANAHLIAAAPELLEAAEVLLAWCNERFDNAGNDWSESAPAVECDALEAAIAKARGER